jgi:hypothetical protein
MPSGSLEQSIEENLDDDSLKARAQIANLTSRQRHKISQPEGLASGGHMAQDRRLQPAEAEVTPARNVRRVAIGVGQPCLGKIDSAIVAFGGQTVDHRPAGITEAKQLRDLVVGFAGRVIAGSPDQLKRTGRSYQIQARVTT